MPMSHDTHRRSGLTKFRSGGSEPFIVMAKPLLTNVTRCDAGIRWRGGKTLVFCALVGWAFAAHAIDLLQTYRAALENDPTYSAARANFDATSEKLVQARGGLLPSATLTGNRAKNHLDNTSAGFQADYYSTGFTVQLSQPLFNWPAWSTYRQGQSLVSQGEAQLTADFHELMVRVVETYFEVVAAQEVLDAQVILGEASLEQWQLMRQSLETGTATITEVDEAKARLDLATAQATAARNDLEVKTFALKELTGQEFKAVHRLRNKIPYTRPQPEDMRAWVESAESDNPSVRARQFAVEVADFEVDRNRGGHLPTLELVANRQGAKSIDTLSGAPNNTMQNAVTLQLNFPLFQGGRHFSKDREAVALKEKARAEWLDSRRSARQLARQSYLGVVNGLTQSIALESALASSLSSLDGNRMGFEVGTRRNLDVLNALSQVADSRQRLTKARIDGIVAQVRLKAAAGRLSEPDMAELNALLEE
jgi:outer membrane protein